MNSVKSQIGLLGRIAQSISFVYRNNLDRYIDYLCFLGAKAITAYVIM